MSATRLVFTTGSFSLRTIPTDCEHLLKKPRRSRANNSPHRLHILFFLSSSLIFFLLWPLLLMSLSFFVLPYLLSPSFFLVSPGVFLHSEVITQSNVSKQVRYARASNYRYARIWNAMTVSTTELYVWIDRIFCFSIVRKFSSSIFFFEEEIFDFVSVFFCLIYKMFK